MSQTFAFEGTTYVNTLLSQDFAHTPVWKAASKEPALSVGNALRIARESLKRLVKKANRFDVNTIALKEFADERWFYEVRFRTSGGTILQESPNKYRMVENEFRIFVKMDGTIIKPKVLFVQPKPPYL